MLTWTKDPTWGPRPDGTHYALGKCSHNIVDRPHLALKCAVRSGPRDKAWHLFSTKANGVVHVWREQFDSLDKAKEAAEDWEAQA